MEGILLPICSCIFSALLVIIYFSKERINLLENKIYSKMLLLSLIDGILVTIVQGMALDGVSNSELLIISIINKLDFVALMYYTGCIFYYTLLVTISDDKSYKKTAYYIMNIINLIAIILIIFTGIQVIRKGNNYSITGTASIVTYLVCGIHLFCSIITVLFFRKKRDIRHIPIYAIIVIIGILFVLFRLNPYLIVISITLTFINYLMYFTIENPDVKMLKEMELAKTDAEKANRAKSDFLSSMSHEIRTPLNAIVGFSECIKTSNSLDEAKDNANDIITASNTLLEIVNGILDISKIESGKLEIVNSKYESKKLLNDVATLIKPKMDEKALDFQISISEDIPEVLYGDHANLKKIITNLLSNAAKYTDSGFVKYDVKCINNNKTTRLIISVEDSGRGIKKENIDKLFTKFKRLDEDRNTTIEGTGLGLAITKQLVELMGGKIVVHSDYKKGSKFTVIIDQKIENEPIKKDEKKKQTKLDLKGKKILIVDDNTLNLKVATKFLEIYNPEVETVESGFACLEKVKDNNYDLILLDDMMPKMSGVETLKKLKENEDFKTPVVVLTANAISGMKEKYLNEGFDDYLAKPINKEELKNILEKVLNKEEKTSIFGELPKEVYEIGNKKQIPIAQPANTTSQIEEEKAENNNDPTDNDNTSILIENGVNLESALELLGGIDTYNETLEEFVNASEKRKQRIEKYLEKENMNDYSIEVHALKSDCKYLGFMKLADIAFNHELKSKTSNQEFIKNNYQELITEWNKILNISKEYLDKIK